MGTHTHTDSVCVRSLATWSYIRSTGRQCLETPCTTIWPPAYCPHMPSADCPLSPPLSPWTGGTNHRSRPRPQPIRQSVAAVADSAAQTSRSKTPRRWALRREAVAAAPRRCLAGASPVPRRSPSACRLPRSTRTSTRRRHAAFRLCWASVSRRACRGECAAGRARGRVRASPQAGETRALLACGAARCRRWRRDGRTTSHGGDGRCCAATHGL